MRARARRKGAVEEDEERTGDALSQHLGSSARSGRKTKTNRIGNADSDYPTNRFSLIRNYIHAYNTKLTYMYLVLVLLTDCSQYFVTACSYPIHA
jgi:hypothetical protein